MKLISVRVKKNEQKVFPIIWINDEVKELKLNFELVGEEAEIKIVGIFFGSDSHRITCNIEIIHKAPRTKSFVTLRGVFKDNAIFENDGLVNIHKGSKGADGYYVSKILLFDNAKGRSVPSLEIDENDLKAGHASTVGRPDLHQLFYLRSRGLSEEEATSLILSGFFTPLLALLPAKEREEAKISLGRYMHHLL